MILVERRYGFLRLIIWLLRITALLIFVLTAVLGVLMFIGIETIRVPPDMLAVIWMLASLPPLPTLVIGVVLPLQLLTVAELIRVGLDVEENTRSVAVSQQTLVANLNTLGQNFPNASTLEQTTRFVADDTQRIAQLLEAMGEEQRALAGMLQAIERKLPPST